MTLLAFTSGESLEELTNDCERMSASPGLNLDPATNLPPTAGNLKNAVAYRWLLDIIRELYLVHDWPFAIQARTLEIVPSLERCLKLPEDFWRVAYKNPLYGLLEGERFSIEHITRPQFFDNNASLAQKSRGQPRTFYVSRPDGLIYLDPIPNRPWIYELHYFKLIAELTEKEHIPQFPYREYLRQALLVKYFADQDDTRMVAAAAERDRMWKEIRGTIYDYREDPVQLKDSMLDPQYFAQVCFDD